MQETAERAGPVEVLNEPAARPEKRMGEAPWPGFEAVQRDRSPGIRARRRRPFQEPSLFTLLKKDERG